MPTYLQTFDPVGEAHVQPFVVGCNDQTREDDDDELMLKLKLRVAVMFAESVTCIDGENVPKPVGVPPIDPVVAANVTEPGRVPERILQLYGGVPPVAETAAL